MFNFTKIKVMMFDREKMLQLCNDWSKNTLMNTLDIVYTDAGDDFLTATMPVNPRVHQPMGLLHGGATVALAESVGSAASFNVCKSRKKEVRGIEISANHLKSKRRNGYRNSKIIHKGASIHLWEIRIVDEEGKLISLCKLTNMVLSRRQ